MKYLVCFLFLWLVHISVGYTQNDLADSFYKRAFKAHEQKDCIEAIRLYTKALNWGYKERFIAYFNRGLAKSMLRRYEEAIEDYELSIEHNPQYFWAYYQMGYSYNRLGKHDEALAYLEALMKAQIANASGDYAYPHFEIGYANEKLGKFEEALSNYHHSRRLLYEPLHEPLGNSVSIYIFLKRYNEAFEKAKDIAEAIPNDFYGHYLLGNTLFFLGKYQESVVSYEKAIKINSAHSEVQRAYFGVSRSKMQLGKIEEALNDCNKSLSLAANFADAYSLRGFIKAKMSKYEEAIQDCEKAISLDVTLQSAYENRGFAKIGLGKYAEAIVDFDKALEKNNNSDYKVYNWRGFAYLQLKNNKKAVEDWEKEKKLAPQHYISDFTSATEVKNVAYFPKNELISLPEKLSPTHPKRLALVIGNGDYLNTSSLTNTINDAVDMKKKLEELGFLVLPYHNLTKEAMEKAVYDFGVKLKNYDAGLFYYSGHGLQYNNENYIIPTDAELKKPEAINPECVNVNNLLSTMKNSQVRINIVILDACRDNSFDKRWSANVRKITKGLAKIEAESLQGSFIMFATASNSVASDSNTCGQATNNGLFTGYLLSNLRRGVEIETVFKATRKSVQDCSQKSQIPWSGSSMEGSFVF